MRTDLPLTNYTLEEIRDILKHHSLEPFRAGQVANWLYKKFVFSPKQMTDLPENARDIFSGTLATINTSVEKVLNSNDGSSKLLVKLEDGEFVEAVLMPEGGGKFTLCISTQVGCPLRCAFCASGALGFERNLLAGEMVEEVLHSCALVGGGNPRPVHNLVIMGMGEPLLNIDNLIRAIGILTAKWGLNFGLNRITLSTALGTRKLLKRLIDARTAPNLAVSLHSASDALRRKLIPHTPASVGELVRNAVWYRDITGKELTFEYVLLGGVNSSRGDAAELARVLKNIKAKVNLIVYNPSGAGGFSAPGAGEVLEFQSALRQAGIRAFIRASHGSDIKAACGQLRLLRKKSGALPAGLSGRGGK